VQAEDDVLAAAGFGVVELKAASAQPVMGDAFDVR
jgi:hypothetical protein